MRRPRRVMSEYFLMDKNGFRVSVCASFFLRTLGFTSNSVVKCMFKAAPKESLFASVDKRGKHLPPHALSTNTIEAMDVHIESFHPCCSHYRRQHAPNCRYLSPDLTVRDMYSYFLEEHPDMNVSYQSYRRRVDEKGISFVKLGVEECETCLSFKFHEHQTPDDYPDCETCKALLEHRQRYISGRTHYIQDSDKDPEDGTEIYVPADMQKVIMLPYMPGIKSCAFVNRLVTFHETFAPPGEQKHKKSPKQVISVLWHEGVSGRSAAEVSSAYIKAINFMANDARHITIWCDNCAAQNKNWTLCTSLTRYMNDTKTEMLLNNVTIKYLETGHTFLSADSFHGLVEKNMRKRDKVYRNPRLSLSY